MGHSDPNVETALQPFWMPFSANKEFKHEPRMVVRAEGLYFYTDAGDKLIDASSGLFCVAAGHCRPGITEAVAKQLQTLDFTAPFLRAQPKSFELAARIAQHTPEGLNRVFFTNSGSESVDSAMKIALMYHRVRGEPQRQLFISRERAYHGVNMGGVALAGMVNNRRAFGVGLPGVYHMRHTDAPETAS
ncbi:MAG: aminotransferase class III-fold pyridoxal phosphate-dependent enzyme [Burkholderiaceae bacterium]